jgi:hypothetical protein
MLDFNVDVITGVKESFITIVPEKSPIPKLLQRAICLVVAHEDSRLKIEGKRILPWLTGIATKDSQAIAQMLTAPADRLKQLLNYEGTSASSVYFSVAVDNGRLAVDLNITPYGTEEEVSTTLYTE